MLIANLDVQNPKQKVILLGISAKNVEELKKGRPISVTTRSHGVAIPEGLQIIIMYGETEQAMIEDLKTAGMIDASAIDMTGKPLGEEPHVETT